jgi:hypothetical protein
MYSSIQKRFCPPVLIDIGFNNQKFHGGRKSIWQIKNKIIKAADRAAVAAVKAAAQAQAADKAKAEA